METGRLDLFPVSAAGALAWGLAHLLAFIHHDVAHLNLVAIRHRDHGQILRIDLDDGDVRLGVAADYSGRELSTVLQRDLRCGGVVYHVIIKV